MALESAVDVSQFALALVTALTDGDAEVAVQLIRSELDGDPDSAAHLVVLALSSMASHAVRRSAAAELCDPSEILAEWGNRLCAAP